MNHVFAVAGAKGGVGKTTNSLNLATGFVLVGREAVVVEADLAMANVVDFLDLEVDVETEPTLHDVLGGDADVTDAIYPAPDGIDVVPSGVDLEGFAEADPEGLEDVLATLRDDYDVVVVDTGAGLNREMLLPMGLADETIVTSTPRVASVRDVEKTIQLAERAGGSVRGILFTKSGTGKAPGIDRIADFLDVRLLGHVPEDEAVPTAQDAGRPVLVHAPDAPASVAYREVVETLDPDLRPTFTALADAGDGAPAADTRVSKIVPDEGGTSHGAEAEEGEHMVLTGTSTPDEGEPAVSSESADPTSDATEDSDHPSEPTTDGGGTAEPSPDGEPAARGDGPETSVDDSGTGGADPGTGAGDVEGESPDTNVESPSDDDSTTTDVDGSAEAGDSADGSESPSDSIGRVEEDTSAEDGGSVSTSGSEDGNDGSPDEVRSATVKADGGREASAIERVGSRLRTVFTLFLR